MYSSFFELESTPFRGVTKPDFLWLSEASALVLQDLEKDLADHGGLFILTGELGSGKSTFATAIANQVSNNFIIAKTTDPRTDTLDLFKHIAHAFALPGTFKNRDEFYQHFQKFLEQSRSKGKNVLLVLDEAQNLNTDKLIAVTSLTNADAADASTLRLLLVGRSEFLDSMSDAEKASLIGDHTRKYSISPLTLAETADYITRTLEYAGARSEIFKIEAIEAIHDYSKGILRQINTICDNALLSAFIRKLDEITPQLIHQTAFKFGLVPSIEIEDPGHEKADLHPTTPSESTPSKPRFWQLLGATTLTIIAPISIFFYSIFNESHTRDNAIENEKTAVNMNDTATLTQETSSLIPTMSTTIISTTPYEPNAPSQEAKNSTSAVPLHIPALKKKVIIAQSKEIINTKRPKRVNNLSALAGAKSYLPKERQ